MTVKTTRQDEVLASYTDKKGAEGLLEIADDYVLAYAEKVVSLVLDHPFAFEGISYDDPEVERYPESLACAERALKTCAAISSMHGAAWFDEPAAHDETSHTAAFRYYIAAWQDDHETQRLSYS